MNGKIIRVKTSHPLLFQATVFSSLNHKVVVLRNKDFYKGNQIGMPLSIHIPC